MKKFLIQIFSLVFALVLFVPNLVLAEPYFCEGTSSIQFSVLPYTINTYDQCKSFMRDLESANGSKQIDYIKTCRSDVLACGINTGKISFWMIPYFVTYITNFLLGMSGIICVLFIVIGGYMYLVGGLTDDKEKGKQTITNALMGMGLALLAWTIVTVLINAVTG